ncbi:MAG: hypothetical protein JST11_22200 [Acidobacteria bacterium]|nr:hypothetical protein [Acidobacteriota bacterium]
MRDDRYIEIPGSGTHELPPLLVHAAAEPLPDLDGVLVEAEEMLGEDGASEALLEQRRMDLALQLAEQYKGLMSHWFWGDSVLEWIRQCEITFECEGALRKLLHPDVWPHASRASFVTLLREKGVPANGVVALEKAVGLRLTFRQPPPIDCCSSQFLFFLNSPVADSAFQAWSHLVPRDAALLPPDRFHFEVLELN